MVQLAVIKPPKDFTFNSNGVVRVLERLPASSYTPQVLYIVFELTDAMVNSGHSLIYMERYDSSTMSSVSNKYVNHPNVKAIFKQKEGINACQVNMEREEDASVSGE